MVVALSGNVGKMGCRQPVVPIKLFINDIVIVFCNKGMVSPRYGNTIFIATTFPFAIFRKTGVFKDQLFSQCDHFF